MPLTLSSCTLVTSRKPEQMTVAELKAWLTQRGRSDIIGAECGCPAGCGPTGSCKHIGALLYALADYIRFRTSSEYQSFTDTLQMWNRPRARKVEPISVDQLGDRRWALLPSNVHAKESQMICDPRPSDLRQPDPQATEALRYMNICKWFYDIVDTFCLIGIFWLTTLT